MSETHVQKQPCEGEAMPGKKPRQCKQESAKIARQGPRVLIAAAVLLSLFAACTLLAYSGAFDSALRQKEKKGKTVSIAGLNSNAPSKEYVYAGGRLVATEEPTSGGCALTSAPSLTATVSSGHVSLSWTAPNGAASFEVQRSQNIAGPFSPLPGGSNLPATTTTFQDNPTFISLNPDASNSNSIVTYIYRVVASDTGGTCTQTSNLDLATNISFLEPINGSGQTIIKGFHITELRVAVNAVWKAANQTPSTITWTDPVNGTPQGLGGYQIRGVHIGELRAKLDQALNAVNPALVTWYNDPSLTPAGMVTVKAIHIIQLRQRVKGN